jgi:hypothetical protein
MLKIFDSLAAAFARIDTEGKQLEKPGTLWEENRIYI